MSKTAAGVFAVVYLGILLPLFGGSTVLCFGADGHVKLEATLNGSCGPYTSSEDPEQDCCADCCSSCEDILLCSQWIPFFPRWENQGIFRACGEKAPEPAFPSLPLQGCRSSTPRSAPAFADPMRNALRTVVLLI